MCARVCVCVCVCFFFFKGINGDDFLVLGVRSGRIVHKFNLGSGVGTVVSERLNTRISIHTVRFGRYLRTGWLKVKLTFIFQMDIIYFGSTVLSLISAIYCISHVWTCLLKTQTFTLDKWVIVAR